jgi:DNA helicase-2/ATP-dependent DNA helicase PcrA
MMPDLLRDGLPDPLADAEIVGADRAAPDESCRLYGPPGTGKSTQAAFRTGARALDEGLSPSSMTVVTYRKALASVVRQRLIDWGVFSAPEDVAPGSASKDNPFRFWNTIHAAACRATGFMEMLDDDHEDSVSGMVDPATEYAFCDELGIRRRPQQPWEETRWTVFESLYNYGKRNLLNVGEYRWLDGSDFPSLRSDLAAERRLQAFRDEWDRSFASVAHDWEQFKRERDAYDFFEQIEYAIVGDLPPVRHLVVDEYHDATPLMAAVTERWIEAADVAIVAGDPDQVVNSYAGASPEFFECLPERVDDDLPEIRLRRSWRCPDEHFLAAARVLGEEREPPALETAGPGILYRWESSGFSYDEDRGRWRLPPVDRKGEPVWLWQEHGPDIMYLLRTQRQADGVAAALDRAGIIYESQSSVGGDWEYRASLMNALALVEDLDHAEARDASRELTNAQATALLRHTSQAHLSERAETLEERLNDLQSVELPTWANWTTDKWWSYYTRGRGSISELSSRGRLGDRDRIAMRAAMERYDAPYTADVDTRILTIHASKGAEASDVVVYDGITSSIREGMDESDDLRENEARTWYVSLTRASERVHVVRDGWEWTDPYLPEELEPRAAELARERRGGDA